MVKVYHGLGIDLCRGFGRSFAVSDEGETTDHSVVLGRTQWQTKYPIQTLEDLERYEPHRLTQEQIDGWVAHERRMQELFAPYTMYVPGGGCGFHIAIYYARDDVERIMWHLNDNSVRLARAAAEHDLCPIYFRLHLTLPHL